MAVEGSAAALKYVMAEEQTLLIEPTKAHFEHSFTI